MCGIIGISAKGGALALDTVGLVIDGLRQLEYRGYDSAGVAVVADGKLLRCRAEGKLSVLVDKMEQEGFVDRLDMRASVAIGHTRWATHGKPCEVNAHPHMAGRVAVVHNGIIENYQELRAELEGQQERVFESETDTEVIAHLMDSLIGAGKTPQEAFDLTLSRLRGAFSIVALVEAEPDLMLAVRRGTPLVMGLGGVGQGDGWQRRRGEVYFASDSTALAAVTQRLIYLEDGDRVVVRGAAFVVRDGAGREVNRPVIVSAAAKEVVGKGHFAHFMLKEIYDQPQALTDTLESLLHPATGDIVFPSGLMEDVIRAPQITLVACGTAAYACHTAKYLFEQIARVPVVLDTASEFRYREPPLPTGGVALFVSQSGETLDTLEALRYCRRQGQKIVSVINRAQSTMARESDVVLPTVAGVERGVASTKAFTAQVMVLGVLALAVARAKGEVSGKAFLAHLAGLKEVPLLLRQVLKHGSMESLRGIVREVAVARDMFFLGRGVFYPLALEGALKMKEISYIHAEGFAAGEMKHGVIALIEEGVPVIVLAPRAEAALFGKVAANVQEVVARGAKVLLVSDAEGCKRLQGSVHWSVVVPSCSGFAEALVYAVPLQVLAYEAAILRGHDPDQPRNLAKSVTVE